MIRPSDVPIGPYRPDTLQSDANEPVPHLNIYHVGVDRFPPGITVRRETESVAETIRRVWAAAGEHGFWVSDQRPPKLPVTHHWIDDSTPHGSIVAERGISPIPSGLLQRTQYWSSALLVTLDTDPTGTEASTASMETPVPLTVVVQVGRVLSTFEQGKHHRWRRVTQVEWAPELTQVQLRVAERLGGATGT